MATVIYGITQTGLVIKTLSVIRADLEAAFRTVFGLSVPLGDLTLLGQIIGILAERYAELWALVQAVYNAQDPDAATGVPLEIISSYTGTFRAGARFSTVTLTLTGTPLTNVNTGTQFDAVSTGAVFASTTPVTLVSVPAWTTLTPYTLGTRVTNSGNVYQCTQTGVSGPGLGPIFTTGLSLGTGPDGSVTWIYLGAGTAASDVVAAATITGPLVGTAGDITGIVNAVSGLSGVTNIADAVLGADLQTDQGLRLTREAELSSDGNATSDAIRAAILEVSGVTACTVFSNNTDLTDANGLSPHSVSALVQGGADQSIINVLFANVAAGITTNGTTTGTATDSQGIAHTISFSRVVQVNVAVDITLSYNPANVLNGGYPANGDVLVQQAVANFGNTLPAGQNVVASSIAASAFPLFFASNQVAGVQGVLDVTSVKISFAISPAIPPAPTSNATIAISPLQIANFNINRVTVHSTPGTV